MTAPRGDGSASGPPFGPLDFVYLPARDVDAAADFYVDMLGAELVWRIRDGETVVANVRVNATGPALLLANHLEGDVPILIFRVDDLKKQTAELRRKGWKPDGAPFEIPHGPCVVFRDPSGQRLALYQLVRPEADAHFAGRVDR